MDNNEAVDRLRRIKVRGVLTDLNADIEAITMGINAMSQTGKWIQISPARIYECSCCGQNVMTDNIECYNYCHGCGAKMELKQY